MNILAENKRNTAERVKAQRIKRRWTQEILATRSNLPTSFIRAVEQGRISLSHMAASKLAMALGCEMGEIDALRETDEMGHYV